MGEYPRGEHVQVFDFSLFIFAQLGCSTILNIRFIFPFNPMIIHLTVNSSEKIKCENLKPSYYKALGRGLHNQTWGKSGK